MASEQERINFCKKAAKLGYTPSELVTIYKYRAAKQSSEFTKEALNPLLWLTAIVGDAAKAIPATAKVVMDAPLKSLGLMATIGALGGAGVASGKNTIRNEYPHLFTNEATPASPELKEERLRQLIARYRNAVDRINDRQNYEKDVQNPDRSPMMRYEFGGFGD